ncbi:hypothetical protein EAS64_40000 [Trebonia kvetii]|uniref:Uncharacterized protein n=1 Tax=Trebonia kvetii TaxID=2480626 RepID=A0A6P2BLD1_9ACTN|nr:hypothetical protein [Trebonia kvetii]TVY99833.1 hypothetical protein EAS64_40000 [Trebonia kvetii]
MYPQLMLSLATERRRDMQADLNAYRPMPARTARRRAPHLTVPKLRVTWSWTTLAAAGRRRGRSYVIVISATRTQ